MNSAVLILVLLTTVVTMMTSLTITPTTYTVSVRLGEAIHLSCQISDIEPTAPLSDVRWYGYPNMAVYGYIDVSRGCGFEPFTCPETYTTDNRGIIRYDRDLNNEGTLTMTIESSTVIDSTTFSCGVVKVDGTSHTSDRIDVIVYVPVVTSPNPDHQTTRGTTSTESTPTATTGRIISSRQTITLFNHDTTPTKTGDPGPMTTSINLQTTRRATTIEPYVQDHASSIKISTNRPRTVSTPTKSSAHGTFGVCFTSTALFAASLSLCVVVIIILLIIIAGLVSSIKKRLNDAERMVSLASSREVVNSQETLINTNQNTGPMYQNTSSPHAYENTLRNMGQQNEERPTNEPPPPVNTMATDYEPIQAGDGHSQHAAGLTERQVQNDAAAPSNDSSYQALEITSTTPSEYTTLNLPPLNHGLNK